MRIGIRDNLLGRDVPLEEKFARAHLLGFDGIEFLIGDDYSTNLLWQEGGANRLAQLSRDSGVAVPSLSPGGFSNRSFIVDEPARTEGMDMLEVCARAGPVVGAGVILTPFFGQHRLTEEHLSGAALLGGLRELDPIAGECDVVWAIESTLSAGQHLALIERAGSPFVKVYYDVGNATGLGYDAPAEIRTLGKAIAMVHMKDTDGQPLGGGQVPFADCRVALLEIGYDGWFVLETPAGDDPLESARANLEFVRTWWERS